MDCTKNILEYLEEDYARALDVLAAWNKKPVSWVVDAIIRKTFTEEEKARLIKDYIDVFPACSFEWEYFTLPDDEVTV